MGLLVCSPIVQGFRIDLKGKSSQRHGRKWNKMEQEFIKGGLCLTKVIHWDKTGDKRQCSWPFWRVKQGFSVEVVM